MWTMQADQFCHCWEALFFYAWMFQQREIRYLQQKTDEPITVSPWPTTSILFLTFIVWFSDFCNVCITFVALPFPLPLHYIDN